MPQPTIRNPHRVGVGGPANPMPLLRAAMVAHAPMYDIARATQYAEVPVSPWSLQTLLTAEQALYAADEAVGQLLDAVAASVERFRGHLPPDLNAEAAALLAVIADRKGGAS